MKKTTSFLLTSAMEDVITSGTGTDAQLSSDMSAAGKSGATPDHTDYWFSGYTPYHTASVWMGYDLATEFESNDLHKKNVGGYHGPDYRSKGRKDHRF